MFQIVNEYANDAVISNHRTPKGAAREYLKSLKKFRSYKKTSPGSIFPLAIKSNGKNLHFWEDQDEFGITEIKEEDYQILCVLPSR